MLNPSGLNFNDQNNSRETQPYGILELMFFFYIDIQLKLYDQI